MLSKRLKCIVDIMPFVDVIADIGTDHGYVAVEIIKKYKAKKVIATDVSMLSLQKAKNYIKNEKLEDFIQTRLGNGIQILEKDEVDALIISGMGGVLISKILQENYDNKFYDKKAILILQPVQQSKNLRLYLYENDFIIIDEHIIKDNGKIYYIIVSQKNDVKDINYQNLYKNKDVYLEFGIINISKKTELLKQVMEDEIEKTKNIIFNLKDKFVDEDKVRFLSKKLTELEEVYCETWRACK